MRSGSRDVAKKVGIPGCDDPNVDILAKVKDWFESEEAGRWLIIYDNVDDIDLMYSGQRGRLAAYFPRSNRGSIVMTTRNKQVAVKFATAKNVITLSTLTQAESVALLTTRLGEDDSEVSKRKELAEALEGIPLALVQASSFIQENEATTIDRYLRLCEASDTDRIQLLSQDFEDETRDYEQKNPIASTWIVTFEYMKEHQPSAANTLCIMSMFDAQAIPESLIWKTAAGDPASATNVERTLGILQAYSLISPRHVTTAPLNEVGRLFDLHRLVRLVTRKWLEMCSMYNYWIAEAVEMIATKYDGLGKFEAILAWVQSKYLSHALALISSPPLLLGDDDKVFVPPIFHGQKLHNGHADKGIICPSCTAHILDLMSICGSNGTQRLRIIRKAVTICTSALGPNHPVTLGYRNREAIEMAVLGDFVSAEPLLRALLAECELTLGTNHSITLLTALHLACSLRGLGRYYEAEPFFLALIEMCKQQHGQKHAMTLNVVQEWSKNLAHQGRGEEAIELNMIVLELRDDWKDRFRLADNYLDLHEYTKAEATGLSLQGDQNIGKRMPDKSTQYSWYLLGRVYLKQSMFEKAEELFLRLLHLAQEYNGVHCTVRFPEPQSLSPSKDGVG